MKLRRPCLMSVLVSVVLLLSGCLGMPRGINPVEEFELRRYTGTWYEIARLDHSFERGLEQVSAQYQLQDDGSVTVINRGFSPADNEWRQADGVAKFVDDPQLGYLKVSFFGPFYGSYVVFALGEPSIASDGRVGQYQYAFVSGPNSDYLWLLARNKSVAPAVLSDFKQQAQAAGFDISQLIMVKQQ